MPSMYDYLSEDLRRAIDNAVANLPLQRPGPSDVPDPKSIRDEAREIIAHHIGPVPGKTFGLLEQIRSEGWQVALHIDRHHEGDEYTFWLFAHPSGGWAEGLGLSDAKALGRVRAMIDIERAPTVGHIWRFAGYDPTHVWLGRDRAVALVKEMVPAGAEITNEVLVKIANHLKRNVESFIRQAHDKKGRLTRATLTAALARRPWNARLKTLCWKCGESFVKVSGKPDAYYGRIYVQRKEYETGRNENGDYADQAEKILREKKIGKDTEAYGHYSEGRLPLAQIHARAKRYAVKLFLSHYHHVAYLDRFGKEPPKPYAIAHLDHVNFIRPEDAQ